MSEPYSSETILSAPAPWHLTGRGYLFFGRFDTQWIREQVCFQPEFEGEVRGGWGAMMLVDYHYSDVGPYQEWLWIPGRYQVNGKGYYHIPQIYVSSEASVVNGRHNWGIPKRLAQFCWRKDDRVERIEMRVGDASCEWVVKPRPIYLPFCTAIIPKAFRRILHSDGSGAYLQTLLSGYGLAQLASVESITVDERLMAPISKQQIKLALCIPRFHLTFPESELISNNGQ